MNKEFPPFYVGQRIVAVKDHSQGHIKKGNEFIVQGIQTSNCKCNYYLVDVGISAQGRTCICKTCNIDGMIFPNGNIWFQSNFFVPIELAFKKIEYSKILEDEVVSCN